MRQPNEGRGVVRAAAPTSSPSRVLGNLLQQAQRRAESTPLKVLLIGPPSGRMIELFHRIGCRVTVDGEETPSVPIAHEDDSFDLIVGADCIDFLDDEFAERIVVEWLRVLRPSGRLYLIARDMVVESTPRYRVEIGPNGDVLLSPHKRVAARKHLRSNRCLEHLLEPLQVEEIFLRRDGLREITAQKPD